MGSFHGNIINDITVVSNNVASQILLHFRTDVVEGDEQIGKDVGEG